MSKFNLSAFSIYEKMDIIMNLLKNYPWGLTPSQISNKLDRMYGGTPFYNIRKVLRKLFKEDRITTADFGGVQLCKLKSGARLYHDYLQDGKRKKEV